MGMGMQHWNSLKLILGLMKDARHKLRRGEKLYRICSPFCICIISSFSVEASLLESRDYSANL